PSATLVTPNLWQLIGTAPFADVPPGQVVRVSDPGIAWAQASIPAPGHYCFIATVGNAAEPAPQPTTFASFNDFVSYIYAHNNIPWRNFNVVALTPHKIKGHVGGRVHVPFLIAGAWDAAHIFTLETRADLPPGSRLALQVPHWLGRGLQPAHTGVEGFEEY